MAKETLPAAKRIDSLSLLLRFKWSVKRCSHACLLKPTASIAHLRPLRVEGLRGLVLLPESVAEYFVQYDSRWQCAG